MSRWCITCQREPYIGCDKSCPVFGKSFGQLAKMCLDSLSKDNDNKPTDSPPSTDYNG